MDYDQIKIIVDEAVKNAMHFDWWLYLLVLLISAIGAFSGSYLKKKAENVATKEDIEEITDSIEKVKNLYASQFEKMKSEIDSASTKRMEYFQKQKNCLLEFYDLAVEFMFEKMAVNFGDFPMDNGESLSKYQQEFQELITNLMKKYQRIVVYIENSSNLRISAERILNCSLKARQVVKKKFGKILFSHIEMSQSYASCEKQRIESSVKEVHETNSDYWKDMKPIITDLQDSIRDFLSHLNLFLRPEEPSQVPEGMFEAEE